MALKHRQQIFDHLSFFMFVVHVTRLGISRSKEIWLEICRSFAYLWPYLFQIVHVLWTAQGCVDGVSFYGPLRSESEFRHHLPVVLGIHNLPFGTCIWRTAGRCCRNSISDRSGSWKLILSTHGRVVLGPIFTY